MILLLCLAVSLPPDANTLVSAVIAHDKSEAVRRESYTHREEVTKLHLGKDGKESSRETDTFDVIFLEGAAYRKLIQQNGKPLPAKQQAKVDADLAKEKARRAGERRNGLIHRTIRLGGIAEAPKFYNVTVSEDSFNGRAVWKVEGTPRAGVTAETEQEKNAQGTKQTWWIDPEEKAVLRQRTEFLGPLKGVQPGSVWVIDFEKIGGECWLPVHSLLTYDLHVAKFIKAQGSQDIRFLDYRKFEVDSSVAFEEPK